MKWLYTLLLGWALLTPLLAQNITQVEYFFDTDRSKGQNPRLNITTPGTNVTQNLTIPLTGLTLGFHLLYLRASDAQGVSSITHQRLVYVVPPAVNKNITQLEYFFDTDRGYGKNHRLNVTTPAASVSQAFTIPLTGLTAGFHLLYLRARNARDVYGITQQRVVYVVPPTVSKNITQLEYFFDTDRGYGRNSSLNLTPGTDVTQALTIPLTGLTRGFHLLYLRARNAQGRYSITQQRVVYVQPNQTLANITKLEYYYVRGTTTTATSTYTLPVPSPNPRIIIPASVSGLTSGLQYSIYIWATNATGTRSLVCSKQFTYRQTTLADMTVKRGTKVVPDGGTSNFGSATLGASSAASSFIIGNMGNATLTLTGNPRVAVTGASAAEFMLVQPTVASLVPAASATFTVAFRPTTSGVREASLRIASNSPYEKPYVINLTGNGTCPAIGAPTALTVVSATSTQINLSWKDNATNETAYLVERATAAEPFIQIASLAANVKTYTNSGLVTKTPYFYRVRAGGIAACTSAYSNVANATPNGTPVAPTALTATAISISQINLAWTDNATNETTYLVEHSTAATGPFTQIASLAANVKTFASSSLTDATAYFYRVRASNTVSNSLYSNVANATTLCNFPAAPIGLSSAATSSSQVSLNWIDEANNETGYLVECAPSEAGPFTHIADLPNNASGFVNNGLKALSSYFYRVRASRGCGNSGYSNVTTVTTATGLPSLRINCGGPAFTTGSGRAFTADANFAGTTVISTVVNDILGTTDDVLYRTQRLSNASPSNFAYDLPAPTGNYTLRLYFAETQFTAVGQRVFSVNVEGIPLLTNYDIVADAGVRTAAIKTFNVRSDGIVNINFTNVTSLATVSAIELIPVGTNRMINSEMEWWQTSESELHVQPNPFSNKVTLSFRVPENSYTTLEVYDARGVLVERLFAQEATADKPYTVEVSGMLWK